MHKCEIIPVAPVGPLALPGLIPVCGVGVCVCGSRGICISHFHGWVTLGDRGRARDPGLSQGSSSDWLVPILGLVG